MNFYLINKAEGVLSQRGYNYLSDLYDMYCVTKQLWNCASVNLFWNYKKTAWII